MHVFGRILFLMALLLALGQTAAEAQGYREELTTDLPGAEDHPWTGRYEGSALILQSTAAYDELVLPAGPAVNEGGQKRFSETVRREGKVRRSIYAVPPGRSSLEVMRNYRNHLEKQGFSVVFDCAGNDGCGEAFRDLKYKWNAPATHVSAGSTPGKRNNLVAGVFDGGRDIRYTLMQKGEGAAAAYVGLFVARSEGGSYGDISQSLTDYVLALVEVVEPEAMEEKIVTLDRDAIAKELDTAGSVALYGLQFEYDKAELKPESDPQLEEMAAYLKATAAKVYVVGHTDSAGSLDYNLDLSTRRARAVTEALTARGVRGDQMISRGVGPLSPIAPNGDEAGRAKNRRVELVLQ